MHELIERVCLNCGVISTVLVRKYWYMNNGEPVDYKVADMSLLHVCVKQYEGDE